MKLLKVNRIATISFPLDALSLSLAPTMGVQQCIWDILVSLAGRRPFTVTLLEHLVRSGSRRTNCSRWVSTWWLIHWVVGSLSTLSTSELIFILPVHGAQHTQGQQYSIHLYSTHFSSSVQPAECQCHHHGLHTFIFAYLLSLNFFFVYIFIWLFLGCPSNTKNPGIARTYGWWNSDHLPSPCTNRSSYHEIGDPAESKEVQLKQVHSLLFSKQCTYYV